MCPAVHQLESTGSAEPRSPAQPEPAGSGLTAGVCRASGGANFAYTPASEAGSRGSNQAPATTYPRRSRGRNLLNAIRFLGRCPTCHQEFTGVLADLVRLSIAGHHFYIHSVRLTEAEVDAAVEEILTEEELVAAMEEERQPRLPLET